MNAYPSREPFYAHRFTRLLFKSCAAQSMGQDAVLLAIHVAHTEDAARYQGPVRFWNSQLNEVLGFRSPKSLNNARRKAVEAGWLRYERKNDRSDGVYWTTIPRHVLSYDDLPIEPIASAPSTESIPSTEHLESAVSVPSTERIAEQESYALRNGKVMHCGTGNDPLPNPLPIPNPKEKRPRFVTPTIDEVKGYCTERRNSVDAEQFHDHYTANGWVQSSGRPIREWKAAVRTWERNGLRSSKALTTENRPELLKFKVPS